MCQLKNGCPGEFWALYSIHATIYKFLDFGIFRTHKCYQIYNIRNYILETICFRDFFEFARYGHTLTSVSSEHAQIVKIVLAINGCTTFIFTIYKKC